jgi:RNA polymerase sigma factor (sigma-70 family)
MNEPSTDLVELVNKMRQGDNTAYQDLVERTYGKGHVLARRLLNGDWRDLRPFLGPLSCGSVDVLHRALLNTLEYLSRPTTNPIENDHEYFSVVARHIRWILRDLKRKHDRTDAKVRPFALEPGAPPTEKIAKDEIELIHAEFENLPDDLRVVIDHLVFLDQTYEEAASVLGVSRDTIKRRYRAAKELLRKRLAPHLA